MFKAGRGGDAVRALKQLEVAPLSPYADDALRWLRRFFNDFEQNPDNMEVISLAAPPGTLKVR